MRRRRNSGVTQLELLISLAIMGMIAVLLANALNFNRQSLERSRFLSDETELVLARLTYRSWVEAIPLDYFGGTAREYFEGDARTLRLRSLVTDGSFRKDEVVELMLGTSEDGGDQTLVVQARGQHPDREEDHSINRILVENLTQLKIRYYGRRSSEAEPRWYDSWSDDTYLPNLVKVEWETGDGDPVPPLTLQPGKIERQSTMSLSSLVPPG